MIDILDVVNEELTFMHPRFHRESVVFKILHDRSLILFPKHSCTLVYNQYGCKLTAGNKELANKYFDLNQYLNNDVDGSFEFQLRKPLLPFQVLTLNAIILQTGRMKIDKFTMHLKIHCIKQRAQNAFLQLTTLNLPVEIRVNILEQYLRLL